MVDHQFHNKLYEFAAIKSKKKPFTPLGEKKSYRAPKIKKIKFLCPKTR